MKVLKIVGIVVGVLVLAFAGIATYTYYKYFNVEGDYVANFIAKNPTKSAIYWLRNDSVQIEKNGDQKMPLASTVKTIIAIEFAQQVAAGKIRPQDLIPISELSRFYIPDTDGGAHPAWLKHCQEKKLITQGQVPLLEVAKGMIRFSSNANTEYLMWRLGLNSINENLGKLGLSKHDSLYPFVSALYVCSDENSAKGLRLMPMSMYKERADKYFEMLKVDSTVKEKFTFAHLSASVQRVWSDRLPGSTVQEYAGLMEKIQSRAYFDSTTQQTLETVMEWPMEAFDSNREKYARLGAKGGSTAFVLTYALYATDKQGNRTILVFFFDNLTFVENQMLQAQLTTFQQKIMSGSAAEQKEIREIINQVATVD
ncbi:serine hydrolase [Arundinibacter roseus]|uniref:beta-lactamase n=1 Tax=Arundinibacter roseus TaxID=2070510 RepID=A0A4R4KM26_9BACT|nr:serine hydrolase [Arundinibacter roseus]TDB69033.1 D-alanyl-D-alanine carboxypeptidase [Arundinibacter roseus]